MAEVEDDTRQAEVSNTSIRGVRKLVFHSYIQLEAKCLQILAELMREETRLHCFA